MGASRGVEAPYYFATDRLGTPPSFMEPETIQAMKRFGDIADDLTQITTLSFDARNPAVREKVLLAAGCR
jgi:hypothetical protein